MTVRIRDERVQEPVARLARPAHHERIETPRDLDEARPRRGMQRPPRVPRGLRGDDPALLHQRLAGEQAALPVLVIDEWQPALVAGDGAVAAPGREVVEDGA